VLFIHSSEPKTSPFFAAPFDSVLDHSHAVYLASDADARIADLEIRGKNRNVDAAVCCSEDKGNSPANRPTDSTFRLPCPFGSCFL